ncbi:DUF4169 family protein [Sneathiella limimaris]|uniref:DUF4169 family protein n=1 Tax=Sneathiella limimaris TaxID=1964213 RepID=UPI00146C35CB|nr:DUF4169 family protein [Sneathiella limimaris]
MGDVVNLNKFRKAKAKTDKEQQASENRHKFGRTKQEKSLEKQEQDRQKSSLDGKQLSPENPEEQ